MSKDMGSDANNGYLVGGHMVTNETWLTNVKRLTRNEISELEEI